MVLWLMTPMAISSAMMMPAMVLAGGVSPGMAIMSRPIEQTLVMASSFPDSRRRWLPLQFESSDTGMKAPKGLEEGRRRLFTASLSMASTAVEPGAPMLESPRL